MFKHFSLCAVCMAFADVTFSAPPSADLAFNDQLNRHDVSRWQLADGWQNGYPFLNRWESKAVTFSSTGMSIELVSDPLLDEQEQRTFYSGELRSHDFYAYGCYEIDIKPINAPGVVTSFFLFSGPYDKPIDGSGRHNEIDIEFLGSNTNMVQMNFWTDDDYYSNSHETLIFLGFDASQNFHRYGISWTKKYLEWFIDGQSVLKVRNNRYDPIPNARHSRMRIMANVWAVDTQLSNWAGLFDTGKESHYLARYRNFSFKPNRGCD
ncbi:family 16 glycosylhydrolase [Vibrio sp. 404]|uniref:Beta-glucanase n=2 Tax=Vibrio marinisediminis TaxID=2758441 RepID=A0A7W2IS59_9VIBR|nr:family 16 glycosylhydrolase [Vibrio marinisediminis]